MGVDVDVDVGVRPKRRSRRRCTRRHRCMWAQARAGVDAGGRNVDVNADEGVDGGAKSMQVQMQVWVPMERSM